jgi:hypothetical protein
MATPLEDLPDWDWVEDTMPIPEAVLALFRPELPADEYEEPPTLGIALDEPFWYGDEPRTPRVLWVALAVAVAAAVALAVIGLPGPADPPAGCRVDVCAGAGHD